jgi:hypothetical protein
MDDRRGGAVLVWTLIVIAALLFVGVLFAPDLLEWLYGRVPAAGGI